jgi:hypothetical protein
MTESDISLAASVEKKKKLPNFEDIKVPAVIGLVTGSGVGTKPLQSFLDGHEEIYMIAAYPLLYFYPHWATWEDTLKEWTWKSIIDIFCEKHASVIDSRKIPGHNGLTTLGVGKNEHIEIDENLFKQYLLHFLAEQEISSKIFLLAMHYAFSLCKQEEIGKKHLLIYHIHEVEYLDYLVHDFPNVKVISMARDPRANIEGRIRAAVNVDQSKLNATDCKIYEKHIYRHICKYLFNDTHRITENIEKSNICIIKLEELYYNQKAVMKDLCNWLGIQFNDSVLAMTFDGKLWWGDKVYNMESTNGINPRVVSQGWKNSLGKIDWFVIEGIQFDLLNKYNYPLYKYNSDNFLNRFFLVFAILYPANFESVVIKKFFNPYEHIKMLKSAWSEAMGILEIKDYTWNATHLYKTTYSDLELWKTRRYVNLMLSRRERYVSNPENLMLKVARYFSIFIYVTISYFRFLGAFFLFPITIMRRWKTMYYALWRRLTASATLPNECGAD